MAEGVLSANECRTLSALADAHCRTILAEISAVDDAVTVPELIERCEIPTATAYRKVDVLVDAELLEETTRIRPRGRNVSEYTTQVTSIHVALSGAVDVDVTCVTTDADREPETDQSREPGPDQDQNFSRPADPVQMSTDGGQNVTGRPRSPSDNGG